MNPEAKRRKSVVSQAMFKLIMIGDSGTGKSCLLNRYTKNQFDNDYKVTIGVEFASKILDVGDNHKVKLQIWDTAGQETFRSIVKSFYRSAAAVILVYNITSKQSFSSLSTWIIQARQNAPKNAIFVLIGTHIDKQTQREVSKQEAQAYMKAEQIALFFETSSKTALNVSLAFDEITKQLYMSYLTTRNRKSSIQKEPETVALTKDEQKNGSCC